MLGIDIMRRAGVGGIVLNAKITNQTVSRASSAAVTATYTLSNNGNVLDGGAAILETWRVLGASSDFEARATLTSGTITGGTFGSWLPLSTSRSWSSTAAASGTYILGTMLVEIRTTAGTILTSATITIEAERV